MKVVSLHYRKFINASTADCRCRFRSENEPLRKLVNIRNITIGVIIESRDIKSLCKTGLDSSIRLIPTHRDRTGRIQTMTEWHQMFQNVYTGRFPLFINLISHAPHDDRRVIAMVEYQIGNIAVTSLFKVAVVSILNLTVNP